MYTTPGIGWDTHTGLHWDTVYIYNTFCLYAWKYKQIST